MIEVLKQSAEDVSKVYDILAFGHTERALEILAKTRTSLRQAIAELESQEPDKYEMDIECTKCGAKQSGVLTVNTHPPQRTWQGLTDEDISEIVRGTHNTGSFVRAIEAKLKERNT